MNNFIVKNENKQLRKNPTNISKENVIIPLDNISIDFKDIAANITGIDRKRENFEDWVLS